MSDDRTILVIDTAMEGCGVAVYDAARNAVFDAYNDEAHGQAQRLVPMVQGVLSEAGIGFDDLTDIVVCNGPGTFTGIRIGLSTAKAFGLTLGIPVLGISSLQALVLSAGIERDVLAVVETRRQDFYVQRFDAAGAPVDAARSVMLEDVDGRVLIGNAVQRFDPEAVYEDGGVRRIDVGIIAQCDLENRDVFDVDVLPIYLRAPDVSLPKNAPRKLEVK